MSITCLITGATGCVGGHLAEACVKHGLNVRGLARPGSDASVLKACGATVVRGDLTDMQSQAGPNRRKHKAFLLGAWRNED